METLHKKDEIANALPAGARIWVEGPYGESSILGIVFEHVADPYDQEWLIVDEESRKLCLIRGWILDDESIQILGDDVEHP